MENTSVSLLTLLKNVSESQHEAEGATLPEYYLSKKWIAYQIITILLWICSAYLLICVIMYEIRTIKSKTEKLDAGHSSNNNDVATVSNLTPDPYSKHVSTDITALKWRKTVKRSRVSRIDLVTRTSLFVSAVFLFLHCNNIIIELHGWRSKTVCSITFQFTIFFYTVALAGVYTTLWDRQRRIYQVPALRHLTNGVLRKISAATLLVTLVMSVASIVILNLSANPDTSPTGCDRKNTSLPRWVRIAILPVLAIAQQAMLLGLVLYPLKKHISKSQSNATAAKRVLALRTLVKRLAICTGCCVLSDFTLSVTLILASGKDSSGLLSLVLTNFNLLVNVICLCLSFTDWKDRLLVFRSCKTHADVQTTPTKTVLR